MRKYISTFVLSAATLTVAAISASPQTTVSFDRPRTFDAHHYTIRARFDRAKKTVHGDTTIELKPLEGPLSQIDLDAVGLKFESITLGDSTTALRHRTAGDKVTVFLDRPYSPADVVKVRMRYSAQPAKGVYFVEANEKRSAQIWTQGEPDEARHWFPSFDFPSDKATFEQFITAEKGETVIGNGEFVRRTPHGETETWHYKMTVPSPTYLVSFVIGKYSRVDEKYGGVPLGFYVYPGTEAIVPKAYGRTADMMKTFEAVTGVRFPFNKYDQTIVASFHFGGMENITATTMADTEIFMAESEFGQHIVMDLVSHELAHSWFGNLVTCSNWAELWLNEGFATFMEAVYREKAFSRAAYIAKIRSDAAGVMIDDTITRRRHGLFNRRADEVSKLFDNAAVTYSKGSTVVHMLRSEIGDDAFWQGVKKYLETHRYRNVTSVDLRTAMEAASGRDLAWFFDQWVYQTGYPKLDIRTRWNSRTKTLSITTTQTQKVDPLIPRAFRLPMELRLEGSDVQTQKLEITKRVQTFTVPVGSKPTAIVWDPEENLVLKSVKERPMVTVR